MREQKKKAPEGAISIPQFIIDDTQRKVNIKHHGKAYKFFSRLVAIICTVGFFYFLMYELENWDKIGAIGLAITTPVALINMYLNGGKHDRNSRCKRHRRAKSFNKGISI